MELTTGEVSASMLIDVGCDYVIIGHSERRTYYKETNEDIVNKIKKATFYGLTPIVCIGETLQQRESGNTEKIIKEQLLSIFNNLNFDTYKNIILAYEPIWAIGSGVSASIEQAQEVHGFIRRIIPKELSNKMIILYGGSVNDKNIKSLLSCSNIDGALVGGASLTADSFIKICKAN